MKNQLFRRFMILQLFLPLIAFGETKTSATVQIQLERKENKKLLTMTLMQNKMSFVCWTDEVAQHPVAIPELKSLKAPFKSAPADPLCTQTIQWGSEKRCYQRGQFPLVDQIIRWCTTP